MTVEKRRSERTIAAKRTFKSCLLGGAADGVLDGLGLKVVFAAAQAMDCHHDQIPRMCRVSHGRLVNSQARYCRQRFSSILKEKDTQAHTCKWMSPKLPRRQWAHRQHR